MKQTSAAGTVPVMRPQLPTAEQLMPYLRRIDSARYYSNHAALLRELESRLAAHFGIPAEQLAVVANGTVALSAALLAVGARPGSLCLLPSWSFVASAAAVWAANLRPHFIDVDLATWMLDPQALLRRSDLADVGAVMVVSAFGAPVSMSAWDDFTAETGIPVIVDGAAAFDTIAAVSAARPARSPIMVSLHATKVFGVGEGGFVVSTDEEIVDRFRKVCNFGVWGSHEGQILGYNGKLSEYHAAVGLASLDGWDLRRTQTAALTEKYAHALARLPDVMPLPGFGSGWVSCYCNIRTAREASSLIPKLAKHGIETRRWWQRGVHLQSAYRNFTRDHLPITGLLGNAVFGLPFFHDLADGEFARIIDALEEALTSA